MQVYIGIVSTNVFETLNPFWAAIDRKWIRPSVTLPALLCSRKRQGIERNAQMASGNSKPVYEVQQPAG
jgi:hypothetical protein